MLKGNKITAKAKIRPLQANGLVLCWLLRMRIYVSSCQQSQGVEEQNLSEHREGFSNCLVRFYCRVFTKKLFKHFLARLTLITKGNQGC